MTTRYPNVFDRVTQKIIADLEKGVRPWERPWQAGNTAGRITRPLRHNGQPYNGINIVLLWIEAIEKGYGNPVWMTFQQALEYGGHVRKGEKSALSVYANKIIKTETDAKTGEDIERQIPFMKGYSVFNVEQIDGLPERFYLKPEPVTPGEKIERIEAAEKFLAHLRADVRHGGTRAYYAEGSDHIQMPPLETFRDAESYYATLLHEGTHWTKHDSRLARDYGRVVWGDEGYAKEELVAEMGAAFLCADLGITPEVREDHAAYIASWLKALKDDRKLIFSAAAAASRAVEFMKAKQPAIAPEAGPDEDRPRTPAAAPVTATLAL